MLLVCGILFFLVACVELITAFYGSNSSISLRDFSSREKVTTLGAVTVRSAEQKRGLVNFKPSFECSHHYADHESIIRGSYSRFATTSMKYKLPAVTLEDIELNLKNIACSESTIVINFPSSKLLAEAEREWKEFSEFLVISSHAGCDIQGARSPYIVSNVDYISNSNAAILSVHRLRWSDAYEKMEVKFGMGQYDIGSLRIHGNLRKRTTSIASVSSSVTVAFPLAPSATPITNTSVHDIGYSVPAGFSLGTFSTVTAGLKGILSIKCANCSIEGTVEVTQGVFTVSNSSLATQKAVNFLENGFFDAVVNRLGAHIEINTSVAGTFTESFNQSLATLTLPGFQIPEIAAIGPMWVPTIRGSIDVSTALDFTYGFEARVPNNSSIRLNIGNLTDSTAHGFNNTSVTALPLPSTGPSIALTLSLSLHSELLLGVNILSGTGSISTGAFLDLPALSVAISQSSSVDQYCNPSNSSSSSLDSPQNSENLELHLFPSLINIVPKAGIALGLQTQAQLMIPEINFQEEVGTTAMVAGAQWALPTVCLSFDGERRALGSPTVGLSSSASGSGSGSKILGADATATGVGGGGSKKSAYAGVRGSVPWVSEGVRALCWMVGLLGSVVFVMIGL